MVKNKKKVVLLIVEGESDEVLLIDSLRETFKEHEIRFEPQRGDILYDIRKKDKSIKEIIGEAVKSILIKRKYKPSDILSIIHILDTDGCLIPEDNILVEKAQKELTLYQTESINVLTEEQKNNIKLRNETRSRNIRTMNSVSSIISKKYLYQTYYFSRNLEHVIFNDQNPCSQTKTDNVEKFLEELTIPLESFLSQYMFDLTETNYEAKYQESWSNISRETNSLKRYTNVPLIFEYIKSNTVKI